MCIGCENSSVSPEEVTRHWVRGPHRSINATLIDPKETGTIENNFPPLSLITSKQMKSVFPSNFFTHNIQVTPVECNSQPITQ